MFQLLKYSFFSRAIRVYNVPVGYPWFSLKRKAAFRRSSWARCGTLTVCKNYRRTRRDATALRFVLLSIVGTTSSSIRMADERQVFTYCKPCVGISIA
jgi:hypothetical protein